ILILMVPPEAFSMSAAQASAAGCIGCDGGTQCEKRHSTVLSCANAGLVQASAAASTIDPRCFMLVPPEMLLLSGITFSAAASFGGGFFLAPFPERVGKRVVLAEADLVACFLEQRGREAGQGAFHVDRVGKVGSDLHVLGEQPEREARRERAGNDVLLHDV